MKEMRHGHHVSISELRVLLLRARIANIEVRSLVSFNLRIESLVIERTIYGSTETPNFRSCFNLRIESLVIESSSFRIEYESANRQFIVSISELRVLLLRAGETQLGKGIPNASISRRFQSQN